MRGAADENRDETEHHDGDIGEVDRDDDVGGEL